MIDRIGDCYYLFGNTVGEFFSSLLFLFGFSLLPYHIGSIVLFSILGVFFLLKAGFIWEKAHIERRPLLLKERKRMEFFKFLGGFFLLIPIADFAVMVLTLVLSARVCNYY